MAEGTITLALEGDITIADYALALRHLQALMAALSQSLAPNDAPTWGVDDLHAGSAITTLRGTADLKTIDVLVRGYHEVGQALQKNQQIPYPSPVRNAARKLVNLTRGRSITEVRFETALGDAVISSPLSKVDLPKLSTSFGAIRGTVQTLTNRRGLRFTLYDTVFDRPISCYLEEEQESLMRNAWGRKVVVSGELSRDASTHYVLAIRHITDITVLDDVAPGSYQLARGVLKYDRDTPAEVLVRRLRDGED